MSPLSTLQEGRWVNVSHFGRNNSGLSILQYHLLVVVNLLTDESASLVND